MKKLVLLLAFIVLSSSWVNAQAQTAKPPHNMSEIAAYSLYLSKFRNDNYDGALKYGRWILLSMPQNIEGYSGFDLSTNLSRFITIYSKKAKQTQKPKLKKGYVDTIQTIFNKAFSTFSKDQFNLFSWKIRQGRFYQDNADLLGDNAQQKALKAYKKAAELNPEKIATKYKGYYLKILLQKLADQGTDKAQQKAIDIIAKTKSYANKDMKEYFSEIRNKLFDKPAEQIAYLKKKLKKNPKDTTALKSLRNAYKSQGKTKKVQKLNQKLYELNPSYDNIVSLANYALDHGNYQQAADYLKEALNKTDDSSKLKVIYLRLAGAQMNSSNFQQAANYAHKAIHADSDWGKPYLKLATIYARTVRNCTQGRKLNKKDRAVYWLVIDYVNKAKRVDSSVANRANTLLETYRPVTPSEQDIFFSDSWEKGGSVNVSSLGQCYSWINETTTVR